MLNIHTCAGGQTECLICPAGFACADPGREPVPCREGFYSPISSGNCSKCPPGHECPHADRLPRPCPVGFWSAGGQRFCAECEPGFHCTFPATEATPIKDLCPAGGYCSPASRFIPCPAGTYNNLPGGTSSVSCKACPAGHYCLQETVTYEANLCPPGHWCPCQTQYSVQHPCPSGTYNDKTGSHSQDACTECKAGSYCPSGTASHDAVLCPTGHFCPPGAGAPMACPAGTYQNSMGTSSQDQCITCTTGHYCPSGSNNPYDCPAGTYSAAAGIGLRSQCVPCDAGMACPKNELTAPLEVCAFGHFCPSGTVYTTQYPCPAGTLNPNASNLIRAADCLPCPETFACLSGTGHSSQPIQTCASGHYCPKGTQYPTQFPCPAGTYTPSNHLKSSAECTICPSGYFCNGGEHDVSGSCPPGYYCPIATGNSFDYPCPAGTFGPNTGMESVGECQPCTNGSFCPLGSAEPIGCYAGTYSAVEATESAGLGAAGGRALLAGQLSTFPSCTTCPEGHSCPERAMLAPVPCGPGYFSGLGQQICTICPAGYFCDSIASNTKSSLELSRRCPAGLFCPEGTDVTPLWSSHSCPRGHFCPEATPQIRPCPEGTYLDETGSDSLHDCTVCEAGYWCSLRTVTWVSNACAPGHFCPNGSKTEFEVPCRMGTYRSEAYARSQDDCGICEPGFYCPLASKNGTLCPVGSYCPQGSGNPTLCPAGTYSHFSGLHNVSQCRKCDAGMFCDQSGLLEPSGLCQEGFYCEIGSSSARPTQGICFAGAYCPKGSAYPTPCPAGTFNPLNRSISPLACQECTPGHFCASEGNVIPDGLCEAGYYCNGGSDTSRPFNDVHGHICPEGHFCVEGSVYAQPCAPGSFASSPGQEACSACPEQYVCSGFGTYVPLLCPAGHYCPSSSSAPEPCPRGTYSNQEGLGKES